MAKTPGPLSARALLPWLAIATAVASVANAASVAAAAAASASLPSQDAAAAADPPPPTAANLTGSQATAVVPGGFGAMPITGADLQAADRVADDVYLTDRGHGDLIKPTKNKRKKKPMGKHKKKKQSFKDRLIPLLIIPFAIQTMLIPMFIMNLKLLALKAMAIGKFAILLIVFNMIRSWSQNSHSSSISGSAGNSMLMAQNYGFNGGPELGALFNG